jgi:SGNH domain (fused to AT3 domains)
MAERERHPANGRPWNSRRPRPGRRTFGRVKWSLTALVAVIGVLSACSGPDSDAARVAGTSPHPAAVSSVPDLATDPVRASTSSVPNPAKDPVRVSLSSVHPAAGSAPLDSPVVYRNGCHVLPKPATRPHFCVYGDKSATRTVVLFGDSHEAQWFLAFNAAAKSEHVKLLYITKSACPAPSVSVLNASELFRACDVWRDNAISLIKKRGQVNLIVFGGTASATLTKRHTAQVISNATARAKEWRLGVRRTVLALRATADDIVIIRDTPHMRVVAGSCLRSTGGDNRGCQTAYSAAAGTRFWSSERQVARGYPDVGTADFTSVFCTTTRCRPVTSTHVVRWRDRSHMTATFSRLLAPRVRAMLHQALAGRLTN